MFVEVLSSLSQSIWPPVSNTRQVELLVGIQTSLHVRPAIHLWTQRLALLFHIVRRTININLWIRQSSNYIKLTDPIWTHVIWSHIKGKVPLWLLFPSSGGWTITLILLLWPYYDNIIHNVISIHVILNIFRFII